MSDFIAQVLQDCFAYRLQIAHTIVSREVKEIRHLSCICCSDCAVWNRSAGQGSKTLSMRILPTQIFQSINRCIWEVLLLMVISMLCVYVKSSLDFTCSTT